MDHFLVILKGLKAAVTMCYKPCSRGKAAPQSEIDGCLCTSLVLINMV